MKISACSAVYGDTDLLTVIDRLAEIGYDGVEITVMYHLRPELTTSRRVREIRQRLTDRGIEASGLHFLFPADLSFVTEDDSVRTRTAGYLGRLADLAADLGAPNLMVGGGGIRNVAAGQDRSEIEKRVAEVLYRGAELAEPFGVDLAFEALNRFETNLGNKLQDVSRIIGLAPHPRLGIGGDLFHMNIEEGPLGEAISEHIGELRHLHLADNDRRGPGSSHVDLRPVVEALSAGDYRRWMSMELFYIAPNVPTFPYTIADRELVTGLRHMRALIAEFAA